MCVLSFYVQQNSTEGNPHPHSVSDQHAAMRAVRAIGVRQRQRVVPGVLARKHGVCVHVVVRMADGLICVPVFALLPAAAGCRCQRCVSRVVPV